MGYFPLYLQRHLILTAIVSICMFILIFSTILTYNKLDIHCDITFEAKLYCHQWTKDWESDFNCDDYRSPVCKIMNDFEDFHSCQFLLVVGSMVIHVYDVNKKKLKKNTKRRIIKIIIIAGAWVLAAYPIFKIYNNLGTEYQWKLFPLVLEFIILFSDSLILLLNLTCYGYKQYDFDYLLTS